MKTLLFQSVIIASLALGAWLAGFILDLPFVESAFEQAYPYVGLNAREHAKATTQTISLSFLLLAIFTPIYQSFIGHSLKVSRQQSTIFQYGLWLICALVVHGTWISNGYYFYDDLALMHTIPELSMGMDLIFHSNGGQPYPFFFMSMKAIWYFFNGHPLVFNLFIFICIFIIPIFVDQFFRTLKLNQRCGNIFFFGYLLLPQWLSFYCGGYALNSYVHITLFFAIALCFISKFQISSKALHGFIGLATALMGSLCSISGLWIIPALLLWVILQRKYFRSNISRTKYISILLSLCIALSLSIVFQYIFLEFYYTKGDTIRYGEGATFSLMDLFKNFSVILSYILSSPLISISFQGVLPAGLASSGIIVLNFFIACSLIIIVLLSRRKKKRTPQESDSSYITNISHGSLLIYLFLMLMGIVFMITLGRYATNLNNIIFHDKYFVMPFFFFYMIAAIYFGETIKNSLSTIKTAPLILAFLIYQFGSSQLWDSIQSQPLRHSEGSSRNRYTFYENHILRTMTKLHENEPDLKLPNLSDRHLFAATAQMNGVYDIHCSSLKSFLLYRAPKMGGAIEWIEDPKHFKESSSIFLKSLKQSTFHEYLYASPVYFRGHHLKHKSEDPKSSQSIYLKNLNVTKENPQTHSVSWSNVDKIRCTLSYQAPKDEALHHATFSKSIDIQIIANHDLGQEKKSGIIRLSNLSMSNSVYLNPEGDYDFYISLLESTALAYSKNWEVTALRFITPGTYSFSFEPIRE